MMFQWNTTNGKWKRVYSQFLSPMIQLYTKATVQSGGATPSAQRNLILLVNRPSYLFPLVRRGHCQGIQGILLLLCGFAGRSSSFSSFLHDYTENKRVWAQNFSSRALEFLQVFMKTN